MENWLQIQTSLADLGYYTGPVDGIRGPKTDAALVAFKKSIGLRARPFFGPLTRRALLGGGEGAGDIPWMVEAAAVRGLHEARNNGRLRGWFAKAVSWIDPRDVAWCGAFVLTCLQLGLGEVVAPKKPLLARGWLPFGVPCDPVFGAVLVFWRGSRDGWKGHVGFYYGEDETHFHVLGGNQSDAVTVTRIAKSRLLDARWPSGLEVSGRKIILTAGGVPVSHNEA